MAISRREFLAFVGSTGITSLLFPRGATAQWALDPQNALTRGDFAGRVREWFYLHNADATHQGDLQLIRVRDEGSTALVDQFALTLRSRRGAIAMPSGYYEVAGEPFSLFVKHTHERRRIQFYRAEFALLQ